MDKLKFSGDAQILCLAVIQIEVWQVNLDYPKLHLGSIIRMDKLRWIVKLHTALIVII